MPDAEVDSSNAPEPIGEAPQPAYEDLFHFVVDVEDDGKDLGGGWQKATAAMRFCEWRDRFVPYCWQCPIEVGMPIRTARHGIISARYAGQITAEVATEVTRSIMHSRPSWANQGGAYCLALYPQVESKLNQEPLKLGARVRRPR